MTDDEKVAWHYQLNGNEFEQTPGYSKGQGNLACCSPWGHKESDTTEPLNNNSLYSHYLSAQSLRHAQVFEILWTMAFQVPLSTGFSRQEYWSGLPYPPPGNLPNPGIKPVSLMSLVLAGGFLTTGSPGKSLFHALNFCSYPDAGKD